MRTTPASPTGVNHSRRVRIRDRATILDHRDQPLAIGEAVHKAAHIIQTIALPDRNAQQQVTPPATARTKFCPVGGELYGEDVKYCPTHGVELRYKE